MFVPTVQTFCMGGWVSIRLLVAWGILHPRHITRTHMCLQIQQVILRSQEVLAFASLAAMHYLRARHGLRASTVLAARMATFTEV